MSVKKIIWVVVGGLFFGYGLAISGMAKPEVVLSFLLFKDFGLLLVMASAVIVTLLYYQVIPRLLGKQLGCAVAKRQAEASKEQLMGAVIFGVGWGLSGMCPGAAIASIGLGNIPILFGIVGMFIGAYLHACIFLKYKK
jgi:hypothetical protein